VSTAPRRSQHDAEVWRASTAPARAALALVLAGLATAGVCRVVPTPGSARAAGGPRFVTEQVTARHHPAPRRWRGAALSRFRPRDLSPWESGATGPSGHGRLRVHAANRKQGAQLDGHAVRTGRRRAELRVWRQSQVRRLDGRDTCCERKACKSRSALLSPQSRGSPPLAGSCSQRTPSRAQLRSSRA